MVPERSLQDCLVRDCINLAMDCAVLLEAEKSPEALTNSSSTRPAKSSAGIFENGDSIKIVLFGETVEETAAVQGGSKSAEESAKELPQFALHVTSKEQVWSLQATVLAILEQWLPRLKANRIKSLDDEDNDDDGNALLQAAVPLDASRLSLGLYWEAGSVMGEPTNLEMWEILLAAVRQVLWNPLPLNNESTKDRGSATTTTATARVLLMRSKLSATGLVRLMQRDWDQIGVPLLGMLVETSQLVATATLGHLKHIYLDEERPNGSSESRDDVYQQMLIAYVQSLTHLLNTLVLSPPLVQGAVTRPVVKASIQRALFPTLLECVVYFRPALPAQVDDRGCLLSSGPPDTQRSTLAPIVLQILYEALQSMPRSQALMDDIQSQPLVTAQLTKLLIDRYLAPGAGAILSILLLRSDKPRNVGSASLSPWCDIESSFISMQASHGDPVDKTSNATTSASAELENDSSVPAKRRKVDQSTPRVNLHCTTTNASISLRDLVASFLSRAHKSAEKLDEAVARHDNDFSGDWLVHSTALSSALRLLAPLLPEQLFTSYPSLHGLLGSLINSMISLSRYLGSFLSSCTDGALFLHLAAIQIETGMFLYTLHSKSAVEGGEVSTLLSSAVQCATDLYAIFFSCDKMLDLLINALAHLPFLSEDPVEALPKVLCSIKASRLSLERSFLFLPAVLFSSLNKDEHSQVFRIEWLKRRTGIGFHSSTINEKSLDETTWKVITGLQEDHEDPLVRLLLWQCIGWLFVAKTPIFLREARMQQKPNSKEVNKLILWLTKVAFADSSKMVRGYASRELGVVFLSNQGLSLTAFLASEAEWECIRNFQPLSDRARRRGAFESVCARVLGEVDQVLYRHCSVSQRQLSFVATQSQNNIETPENQASFDVQASTTRALLSMCQTSNLHGNFEQIMLEQSLKRLFCMLSGSVGRHQMYVWGLTLGELCLRGGSAKCAVRFMNRKGLDSLTTKIVRDTVFPASGFGDPGSASKDVPIARRERQYRLLWNLVDSFFLDRPKWPRVTSSSDLFEIEAFFEDHLPSVISQLIVDEDYDALKLTVGFKLYLEEKKLLEKLQLRRKLPRPDHVSIGEKVSRLRKGRRKVKWSVGLEEQTRSLCLAPAVIDLILPLVLKNASRSSLTFFLGRVLQNKISLQRIINANEQKILKGLMCELGRDVDAPQRSLGAIKIAAIARQSTDTSTIKKDGQANVFRRSDSMEERETSAACEWVSSQFMYFLVNVVQKDWTSKPYVAKLEAMQSLRALFQNGLLRSEHSSQYIPHVIQVINAAFSESCKPDESEKIQASELTLCAVEVLSLFVKLVAQDRVDNLGPYLTTIVVSLIPLLPADNDLNDDIYVRAAKRKALAILEWLVQGEIGTHLAGFFCDIPFLPDTVALEPVRAALRRHRIDVDSLSTSGKLDGPQEASALECLTADGMSTNSGSPNSSRRQRALRKRLSTICSLLSHENTSVRCVSLSHLTALLRANRELFHAVIENEPALSMKRYVTTAYGGSRSGKWMA